ncbi:MAG: hypothetical protein LBI87_03050 [Candidatus Accumulibacter sp.]|jgi:hypothetical protein|nr:hypothetical protein [Accumulibacter sp.]
MGLFDRFKKNAEVSGAGAQIGASALPAKAFDIDVSKKGLLISGVLVEELTMPALTAVFGVPRVVLPEADSEAQNTLLIWDDAGVWAYTKDLDGGAVEEISIRLVYEEAWEPKYDRKVRESRADFSGTLTLGGKPVMEKLSDKRLGKSYGIISDLKFGNWRVSLHLTEALGAKLEPYDWKWRASHDDAEAAVAAIVRGEARPFAFAWVSYSAPRVSTGKHDYQKTEEPPLSFSDFNFKLAVVQALMYDKGALLPRFDVYDFAKGYAKREIDVDGEGYEPIREVKAWFKDLPVPASLGALVEELYIDGGNEIYLQVCPQWDGEDRCFDVKAIQEAELAQFPNLRKITNVMSRFNKKTCELLREHGIELVDV